MNAAKTPGANFLLIAGIVLVVLGALAIASPIIATGVVVKMVGALLLAGGIVQIIHGLKAEGMAHKLGTLVLGLITAVAGIVVLAHDFYAAVILTYVLAAYFVVEGIWKIIASFSYRPASGWLALLFSGVVAIVLGCLIWIEWPSSAIWVMGLLVGVNLVVTGVSLVALSMTIRSARRNLKEAISA